MRLGAISCRGPITNPRCVARGCGSVNSADCRCSPSIQMRSRSRVRAGERPAVGVRCRPWASSMLNRSLSRSSGHRRVWTMTAALTKLGPSAATGADRQMVDACRPSTSGALASASQAMTSVSSGADAPHGRLAPMATAAERLGPVIVVVTAAVTGTVTAAASLGCLRPQHRPRGHCAGVAGVLGPCRLQTGQAVARGRFVHRHLPRRRPATSLIALDQVHHMLPEAGESRSQPETECAQTIGRPIPRRAFQNAAA